MTTDSQPTTSAGTGPAAAPGRGDLALVVAAFFFGTTFVVVQDAVERADAVAFLGVRFTLAAAVLGAVAVTRDRRAGPTGPPPRRRWRELCDGLVAGVALLVAYVLQTVGLQYTDPSTSAFLTYLLVLFVPLIGLVALGRRPHPAGLVGVAMAVVGLLVLTGAASGGMAFGRGEALTLGCALAFAAHIVVLGEVAWRHDAVRLTCVQMATVGLACGAWAVLSSATGGRALASVAEGSVLAAAAFTGLFASALAFLAMSWAQKVVSPTRAAIVLLLEPVFAALLDRVTGGDLPASTVVGGGLILCAVAVAEAAPSLLPARA